MGQRINKLQGILEITFFPNDNGERSELMELNLE